MRVGPALRRGAAALLAVAAVAAAVALGGPSDAAFERQFRVRVRAFPVEPDPGQNERSFGVRPVAVEGGLASAPLGANGRAAILDLGFIENQTVEGRPIVPEEGFARCDSVSPNVPDDEERTVGLTRLVARCPAGPQLDVRAEGISPGAVLPAAVLGPLGISGGTVSSRVSADASGASAKAESVSDVSDLTIGPLRVEHARFSARVEANGEAGGARAEWSVDAMAASVNGVPVVIGTDGVKVDDQVVPAPLLADATNSVQEAFAQSGGYIDVRVLAPEKRASDDGASAEVKGGGLRVFLASSPEPTDREFLGLTLLGGHVAADVGGPRTAPFDLAPFTGGAARVGGAFSARPTAPGVAARPTPLGLVTARPEVAAAPAEVPAPEVSLATATAQRSLAQRSSWWAVAAVLGALLVGLVAASSAGPLLPARRRAERWWDATAERFLRG